MIVKGRLEPKSNILSHPEMYSDVTMLCFVVSEAYKGPLTAYYNENGIKDYQELSIEPWPLGITERAKKHFFAMRDAFVLASQGDIMPDRAYKDQTYRDCIRELDIRKDGKIVSSLKDLDKREMWQATELMNQWCIEAGVNLETLGIEHKAVQKELRE